MDHSNNQCDVIAFQLQWLLLTEGLLELSETQAFTSHWTGVQAHIQSPCMVVRQVSFGPAFRTSLCGITKSNSEAGQDCGRVVTKTWLNACKAFAFLSIHNM